MDDKIFDHLEKTLFVMGLDPNVDHWLSTHPRYDPQKMFTLKCHGPFIEQPYDSIMRSIILAVYNREVERIVVIASTNELESQDTESIRKIIPEETFQTVDYLLRYGIYPNRNLDHWLKGTYDIAEMLQLTVNTIRSHPLLPSQIEVEGVQLPIYYPTKGESL